MSRIKRPRVKRANKARKLVKELIEGGDEDDKRNKSNVDT